MRERCALLLKQWVECAIVYKVAVRLALKTPVRFKVITIIYFCSHGKRKNKGNIASSVGRAMSIDGQEHGYFW